MKHDRHSTNEASKSHSPTLSINTLHVLPSLLLRIRMLTSHPPTPQAARRARELELERAYLTRRGHAPQISISDDNHHVTEAIGDMYGNSNAFGGESHQKSARPLSFLPASGNESTSPSQSSILHTPSSHEKRRLMMASTDRTSPLRGEPRPKGDLSPSDSFGSMKGQISHNSGQLSPPQLNRIPSETAQQQFSLTDLDSTAAVAQELSNLQAIRRMSMDVNTADPDLPSFNSTWAVPTIAPTDEDESSGLFWVPASVHPELAPKAFETFIQDRVKTIKRSSLGQDVLSRDMISGGGAGGSGLQRKKSMLSRQVHDAGGYEDGAARLERKRSISDRMAEQRMASLHELEDLAPESSGLSGRLSADISRNSYESGSALSPGEDTPILAPKTPGQTLKRSTRTTYRRGSQRKAGTSTRQTLRGPGDTDEDVRALASPSDNAAPQLPALPDLGHFGGQFGLSRVQTDPLPQPRAVENFSRPGRRARTPPVQAAEFSAEPSGRPLEARSPTVSEEQLQFPSPESQTFQSRLAINGRTTASLPPKSISVPTIIETPPQPNDQSRPNSLPSISPLERSSSVDSPLSQPSQGSTPGRPTMQRPQLTRPGSVQQQQQQQPSQSQPQPREVQSRQRHKLDQSASQPSPMPLGNLGTRTDTLSFIPTYADDKKVEKKGKDKKDDGVRKPSWGFSLFGNEEKKKQEEEAKKAKGRANRPPEKGHDNTRLDLLQTSIDGSKGRESLVLDRQTIQVEPVKKPSRKPSGEAKKEKEAGLFSSIFGGGKKKGEKDSGSKKSGGSLRGLSPDPPQRRLQADVDFNWSRFSILEERAIYRMAHIKLANPRRELYSQVLLSNFMYSYLAKVQQMHPQIQIPQSAAQKQQQRHAQQQKKTEVQAQQSPSSEEFTQYQRYQEQQARLEAPAASSPQSSSDWAGTTSQESLRAEEQEHAKLNSRKLQHSQTRTATSGQESGVLKDNAYCSSITSNHTGQASGRSHQQQQPAWEHDDYSSRGDRNSVVSKKMW